MRGVLTAVALALLAATACEPDQPRARPTLSYSPPYSPPTVEPPPTTERAAREAKILADAEGLKPLLDGFWTRELSRLYRVPFDAPDRFEWYRGTGNQPCGRSNNALPENAYYCPVDGDEYVAFDMNWFEGYLRRHPGGATTFLILAHEWGHAVQDAWLEAGGKDVWNPPYRQELNADCLAGVFLADAIASGQVVEESGDSDAIWGWLYEAGGGTWLDPSDHGTPEQRQQAFADGYANGTDYCRVNY